MSRQNYIGIVLENKDPKRLGRCRVRVVNFFDTLPVEDIPWATPWKDPNGNQFIIPEIGKIVSVHFDSDNIYKPEYIYSENYNINLERKLQNIDESDYVSMRALMFDHKTQIYSNDSEGLVMDHKYNKVSIRENDINLELKDNFSHVNIGSKTANQQAILGNHFLNWMENFLKLINTGMGFLSTTSGGPVVATAEMSNSIFDFFELKDPKFLSHHINLVDNNSVDTWKGPLNKNEVRVDISQVGDSWKSTKPDQPNNLVKIDESIPKPTSGNTTDPVPIPSSPDQTGQTASNPVPVETQNPEIEKILRTMRRKGYEILERPWEVNIVAIRKKTEGDKYSNAFDDELFVIYKIDGTEIWQFKKFKISTMPGYYMVDGKDIKTWIKANDPEFQGLAILAEAHYKKIYEIATLYDNFGMVPISEQKVYRDSSEGDTIKYTMTGTDFLPLHIGGSSVYVSEWSSGSQVFASKSEIEEFSKVCRVHEERYGNYFNYTLMLERDLS